MINPSDFSQFGIADDTPIKDNLNILDERGRVFILFYFIWVGWGGMVLDRKNGWNEITEKKNNFFLALGSRYF